MTVATILFAVAGVVLSAVFYGECKIHYHEDDIFTLISCLLLLIFFFIIFSNSLLLLNDKWMTPKEREASYINSINKTQKELKHLYIDHPELQEEY